jgi:hypothetical protein
MSRESRVTNARCVAAHNLPEDRLMAQIQGGDLDAFEALYDRFSARAYRTALAIARDFTSEYMTGQLLIIDGGWAAS